ncbi:hypothetical protein J1614_012243 [Plenodomus biglobosus]|nr:hypothetical protein J1614_012243 [Plenodomus biglobosus]
MSSFIRWRQPEDCGFCTLVWAVSTSIPGKRPELNFKACSNLSRTRFDQVPIGSVLSTVFKTNRLDSDTARICRGCRMVKISEQMALVVDDIPVLKRPTTMSVEDLIYHKYRTISIVHIRDAQEVKFHYRDSISPHIQALLDNIISSAEIRVIYNQTTDCTVVDLSQYQSAKC